MIRCKTNFLKTVTLLLVRLLLLQSQFHLVQCFGLGLGLLTKTKFTTQPLNTNNRQQDELRLVTNLFVESFWQGKVGGGTQQLTEAQNRTLQAQQYSEFRKRYSQSSSPTSQMIVCKSSLSNGAIVGCAGVEIDTVATFAEDAARPSTTNNVLAILFGSGIPAKPTGRWDTKLRYAPVMSNLVVSRDVRRQGIAEQLVQAVEDHCQTKWDYDVCYLYVEKRNAPAVKLYQKLGYTTIWQDDKAQTLLPTQQGQLENSPTVILCMKKELKGRRRGTKNGGGGGLGALWPFG